ncbi:hypothetical protein BDW62DRAFT_59570 [Aspergillus aurantiobrunneus]
MSILFYLAMVLGSELDLFFSPFQASSSMCSVCTSTPKYCFQTSPFLLRCIIQHSLPPLVAVYTELSLINTMRSSLSMPLAFFSLWLPCQFLLTY